MTKSIRFEAAESYKSLFYSIMLVQTKTLNKETSFYHSPIYIPLIQYMCFVLFCLKKINRGHKLIIRISKDTTPVE